MSLLFNMLSRFVIAFLPRSKHLLIFWLHSPSAVILESKKIKSVTVSIFSPSICHEVMGLDAMVLAFRMLSFKPAFSLSPLSRGPLVPLSLVAQLVRIHLQWRRPWLDSWFRKICWRRDRLPTPVFLSFPGGSDSKEFAAIWKTWVQSVGWEDPLEEGMATHSSILAWRISMGRGVWTATLHGVAKSQTWLSG